MARILEDIALHATDPDGGAPSEAGTLGSGSYFKLNDFATSPLRSSGWHNLKTIITTPDGVTTNYQFFVDGTLAEKVSGVGTAGTLRSYDNIAIGSGFTNGGVDAYFDNMSLQVTPALAPSLDRSLFARYRRQRCWVSGDEVQVIVYRLQNHVGGKRGKSLMC